MSSHHMWAPLGTAMHSSVSMIKGLPGAGLEDQKGTRSRLHDHVEGRESNLMMLVMAAANKKHLRSAINE